MGTETVGRQPGKQYDILIIGGGPAGMAAAAAGAEHGASVCLIERNNKLGGILKQCIHDGFGIIQFNERLTGPEYAYRYRNMVKSYGSKVTVLTSAYASEISYHPGKSAADLFTTEIITAQNGALCLTSSTLILAMGCREKSDRQVFIHGDRPAGILTAGQAQYFINIQGLMPCKRCVILGSGDIGLIMARRLVLEGAVVEGVYEIRNEPSGLKRNIVQCLDDFSIPLHLQTTVTEVHGRERVESITVCKVDDDQKEIPGTERTIECDSLIVSVGLIPENDILSFSQIFLDPHTGGPEVDQNMQTRIPGLFSCGNALHVCDLVDYVSESGETAGTYAAKVSRKQIPYRTVEIQSSGNLVYQIPHFITLPDIQNKSSTIMKIPVYFRVAKSTEKAELVIRCGNTVLFRKRYSNLSPPEMKRAEISLSAVAKAALSSPLIECIMTDLGDTDGLR